MKTQTVGDQPMPQRRTKNMRRVIKEVERGTDLTILEIGNRTQTDWLLIDVWRKVVVASDTGYMQATDGCYYSLSNPTKYCNYYIIIHEDWYREAALIILQVLIYNLLEQKVPIFSTLGLFVDLLCSTFYY